MPSSASTSPPSSGRARPPASGRASLRAARILGRAAIAGGLAALLLLAFSRLEYRWDFAGAWAARGRFLEGLAKTIVISAGSMALALPLGAAGCVLRLSRFDAVRFLGSIYVEGVRGTPLLVQLYVAYFCIAPVLGVGDPVAVGIVALATFTGAYVAEIFRAGIASIDRGQTEAARVLGLTRAQTLIFVLAPQAVRRVIPPLAGQLVSLVKDSSLLSVIAVVEVTKVAEMRAATTLKVFESYLPLAVLYLAVTLPLSRLAALLERRLAARG
jgi:polar amino acid transport system permease protein